MIQISDEEIIQTIKQCGLFKGLDRTILTSIFLNPSYKKHQTYKKNDLIVEEGSLGNHMYIILRGKVEIRQRLDFHLSKALQVFSRGEYFGELALLCDSHVRSASARALEDDTVCIELSKTFLDFFMKKNPGTASKVIENICQRNHMGMEQLKSDLNSAFQSIIHAMGIIAEYRDPETAAHLQRVSMYTTEVARHLQGEPGFEIIDDHFVELIGLSSPLHDVGKVGIPDAILLKPGKLDSSEWTLMKQHSVIGGAAIQKILQEFCYPHFLKMGRNISLYHHEKWNGEGYPEGLSGNDIPLEARIMALADIYDALRCKRCYKDPFPHPKVRGMILEMKDQHLDGRIVDVFTELESKFETLYDSCQD